MKKLLRMDWDVIAGIAAAVLAIILHLLHIAEHEVLLTILLVLVALLLFRDLRRESNDEHVAETIQQLRGTVLDVQTCLNPVEAILVGPRQLRAVSRRFCEAAHGEMVWFNVCFTMFRAQEVFDLMLKTAIENPDVESLKFVASEGERELWMKNLLPKIRECQGSEKVAEPHWRQLPETVSFILADNAEGNTEALLSFWGEPFMSRATGTQAPRYLFLIQSHSDLIAQFIEIERQNRSEP